MLLGFAFAEAALKALEGLPAKFRGQVKKKCRALAQQAHPPGSKKLQGVWHDNNSVYRIRSGDYRVLYVVKENPQQVIVLAIENRKDAYR